jgi:uncharacterized protein (TIGR03435 family)
MAARRQFILFASLFAVVFPPIGAAQASSSPPEFEVISIKPNLDGNFILPDCAGNRFTSRLPLDFVVRWAYELGRPFLQGLPDWASSDAHTYVIEATAPAEMSPGQCKAMVKSMLAGRFKMTTHHEQREMRAYALTVDKRGPKMRAPRSPGEVASVNGMVFVSAYDPEHGGMTMARFASSLGGLPQIGMPVVDRTALTGNYVFELEFSVKEDDGLPSLQTAIEEQLGLKLESIKAPIEVLVVDHIERPTAN